MRRTRTARNCGVLSTRIRDGIARKQCAYGGRVVNKKIVSLMAIFVFAVFTNQASLACDVARDYLQEEELIYSVGIRDLIKDSHSVITGRFLQYDHANNALFLVLNDLKAPNNFEHNRTINVTFFDVIHFYSLGGKDSNPDSGSTVLKAQINYGGKDAGGWGGELSGIYHSADCERTITLFTDQPYLLFLDDDSEVKALFPIKDDVEKLLPALQSKIDKISTIENYK